MPEPVVEVVAGVIADARGRILLARRTEGRDLAGLWEFPGGKREPGEAPDATLARELHEELGIAAEVGAPLIAVPQQYPHKRLRLDVRRVDAWQGTPKGLDGQALAWVPPRKLASYAMPPADRPVVAALLQPDRYLVTPAPGDDDAAWLRALETALAQGVRRVQLRPGAGLDPARWRTLARQAAARCRGAQAEVLVNGDIALAQELRSGVHLRAAQLPQLQRRPLRDGLPVAASCHDRDELRHAERLGCDFAVLGPLQPTPTHPGAAGLGWAAFAALREHTSLPLYAIGGLRPDDLAQARTHGAQGIAAIRALWPARVP
ncbi:Nudix family hydrolase [Cognatiluteimonas weifangensis]|uniref:8-oxo-dGTP diphosphatase n=1 Tax=Cognatiluteimonas weifangensis TaxID=2303539 RepID=A0A372DSW6_9GAMM|nr:Nudix family hydrolase [Luteimonas weifangensis]RFP62547.1 Nudix family hydrolase [Luteimonas weifangensis]